MIRHDRITEIERLALRGPELDLMDRIEDFYQGQVLNDDSYDEILIALNDEESTAIYVYNLRPDYDDNFLYNIWSHTLYSTNDTNCCYNNF